MSKLVKTILITGASSGIGKSILELLASEGHNIIFTYNRRRSVANKLVKKLRKKNNKIFSYKIDLEKHREIDKLFSFVSKKFKKVDCLINNAAYFVQRKNFEDLSLNHAKKVMDINYFAVFKLCQLFTKLNKKNNHWKSIINITSTAAKFGGLKFTHYAPTKAALENLAIGLSRELSSKKIRVLNIAPGIIDTRNLLFKGKKSNINKIISTIPSQRLGQPIEVANLVNFLIDDNSNYINGTTITISGGR